MGNRKGMGTDRRRVLTCDSDNGTCKVSIRGNDLGNGKAAG